MSVVRFPRRGRHRGGLQTGQAHTHDFLALTYFERGGGSLRLGEREWSVEAGDAYVVAPGEVIGGEKGASGFREAEGWVVSFPPEALGLQAPGVFLSWHAHPLLFPFVGGAAGDAQRLKVPLEEQGSWSERFSALDLELNRRRDGYPQIAERHCRADGRRRSLVA